jgi:diacylglycerol kinase (ATP)
MDESMPGRSIALIANPGSRSCDPDQVAAWLSAAGAEVEMFELGEHERAAASGAERVVVAGGDGSVAPVAAAAGAHGAPLGVVPAGTANDFARGQGLPDDAEQACVVAVRGERRRALDLGWMAPPGEDRGRPFVNVSSLGLPAPAAERARSWKRALGPLAYAAGALVAGLTTAAVPCRATCDGELVHDGPAWQVTVACSGAFGAGSQIDEADPADGELDLVAMEAGSRLRLPGLAYRLRTGGLTDRPGVVHASGARIGLEAPAGATYNVDGELVEHGPARFEIQPRAFELVAG